MSLEPDAFLAALLDALELRRPVLVSPSLSGRFSLPFAARSPGQLAGFVPIAPAGVEHCREELAGAHVETLVIWGRNDRTFPVAGASDLAGLMPSASIAVIEDAGHACYLDQSERFHELLLAFLARAAPTGTTPARR
ncbi:MAG: alpha/beta hydrolase [Planctomycetes bacterium]|nr:alpha/beta hydrolase [Planctomycetota bacterium]